MYEGEVLPEFKMGKVGEPKGHTEVLGDPITFADFNIYLDGHIMKFGGVTLKKGAGRTSLNKEFGFKQLEFKSDLGEYKVVSQTKKGLTTKTKFDKLEWPTIEWYPTEQGPGGGIFIQPSKGLIATWKTPLISKNWFKLPKKKPKGLTGKDIREIYEPFTETGKGTLDVLTPFLKGEAQRLPKTGTSQKTQIRSTDLSQKLVGGNVVIPSLHQTTPSSLSIVSFKPTKQKPDMLFSTQKIEASSIMSLGSGTKQHLQTEKGLTEGIKFGKLTTQRGIDLILEVPTPTPRQTNRGDTIFPPIVSPPIVPPTGGGRLIGAGFYPAGRLGRSKKRIKGRKQPRKYAPTLVARTFRIRGKKPKRITGLEIRPIVKKSRKKKKRRKSRRKKVRF
jgi:hypothetical protein